MKMTWMITMAFAVFGTTVLAQNLSLREVPTREGVKQKFVYQRAAEPVASAVLFQGGPGFIGVGGSVERGNSHLRI